MTRPWRSVMTLVVILVALTLAACGDDEAGADNNDWGVGEGDAGADVSADAGADAAQPDAGVEVPFEREALEGTSWYAIQRLTDEPAITGSVLKVELGEDGRTSIGFRGEVTGSWEIFGDERVRLFDLTRGDQPNQPPEFVLDADLEDSSLTALELYLPQGPSGSPYIMRFEQLDDAQVAAADVEGNWQSVQTYTGEAGGQYRLVARFLGDTLGYGIYNGSYIEFVGGQARLISYDTGETFWFVDPPATGEPRPALAGEARVADDQVVLFAPRQTNAGEQPAEFEAVELVPVDAFSLDAP